MVGVTVQHQVGAGAVDRFAEHRVAEEGVELQPLAVERVRDGGVVEQDDANVADERGEDVFQRFRFRLGMTDPGFHLRLAEIVGQRGVIAPAEALGAGDGHPLPGDVEDDAAAVENVDAGVFQDGGDGRGLIGVIVVVAEHGDDGDADLGQLGGEDLGFGGFPGASEITGQEEDIRLIAQPGEERRERPRGLGPGMDIGNGSDTDHVGILPRVGGGRCT